MRVKTVEFKSLPRRVKEEYFKIRPLSVFEEPRYILYGQSVYTIYDVNLGVDVEYCPKLYDGLELYCHIIK